jgi:ApeA N-terminal domain 1
LAPKTHGEFDGFLKDLAIDDASKEVFEGLSFDSEAFGVWYAPPAFTTNLDAPTRRYSVEIREPETKSFDLPEMGRITCTTEAEVASRGYSGSIRSAAIFRIDFHKPISLSELVATCRGLARLFGFLIGFRGRLPTFTTWLKETYKVGDAELRRDGSLEIAGVDWRHTELPHPMNCIHRRGCGGGTLERVLESFLRNSNETLGRIHAVEFSRYFSRSLNDRFSVVMPALEGYVTRRYMAPDEATYIKSEKAFFDWIKKSDNEEIIEFSRKHIIVTDRKSPSLKTLLGRAIAFVNSKGFSFPSEIADSLQSRRGTLFHSMPATMTETDVMDFYTEVLAATALLMLHTFDELGIDISCLTESYMPLSEFREFFRKPANSR